MFGDNFEEIRPSEWQQSLEQICVSCNKVIQQQNCISICKCLLFTHEKCFIEKYIKAYRESKHLKCRNCHEEIEISGETLVYINLQEIKNWKIIASFLLAFVLQILFIFCWVEGYYEQVLSKRVCVIISTSYFGLAAAALCYLILRKKYREESIRIKSTALLNDHYPRRVKQLNQFNETEVQTYITDIESDLNIPE